MEEKRTGDKEKRSNLGRGLAALFGDTGPPSDTPGTDSQRGQHSVPLEHIHPNPRQPRQRFDQEDLAQLADSIRENGVIQPIIVRHHPDRSGEYEIVAGERRWRAAQLAQLHQIPALVRDISDVKVLEIALLENIQRADLTPIEEAQGYRRLMDEFSYTQANLAQSLGKSRSHIANALRLLTLPEAPGRSVRATRQTRSEDKQGHRCRRRERLCSRRPGGQGRRYPGAGKRPIGTLGFESYDRCSRRRW
jgi:ParB family chromosome partitioning protein